MNKLKALSWKEPYASLMLLGKIETRTWYTKYRGQVLICASQKAYSEMEIMGISGELQTQRIITTLNRHGIKEQPGRAIAIAELVSVRPMRKADEMKCFVEYNSRLYCHIYKNVRPIIPFDWKGSQGWTDVPETIVKQIEETNGFRIFN